MTTLSYCCCLAVSSGYPLVCGWPAVAAAWYAMNLALIIAVRYLRTAIERSYIFFRGHFARTT